TPRPRFPGSKLGGLPHFWCGSRDAQRVKQTPPQPPEIRPAEEETCSVVVLRDFFAWSLSYLDDLKLNVESSSAYANQRSGFNSATTVNRRSLQSGGRDCFWRLLFPL